MIFNKITFIYPQDLTSEQEDILIINLQEVRVGIVKQAEKRIKKFEESKHSWKRFLMNKEMANLSITQLEILKSIALESLELNKPDGRTYTFIYPKLDISIIKQLGNVIPKDKLIQAMTGPVAKDMKIVGIVETKVEEIEK